MKESHAETESASQMVRSLYRQTLLGRDVAEHYIQHRIIRTLQTDACFLNYFPNSNMATKS